MSIGMIIAPEGASAEDIIAPFSADPIKKYNDWSHVRRIMLRSGEVIGEAPLDDVSNNTWTAFDFDVLVRNDDNGNPVWYERNPAQSQDDWEAHMRQLIAELRVGTATTVEFV